MKYDLRSCLRKFWMLWAGLAALAMLNGYTINHVLDNSRFSGLPAFLFGVLPLILFFVLGIATAILILVFICDRFYKGLLGDEGYLAFTLPVSSAEHIASKALVSLILVVHQRRRRGHQRHPSLLRRRLEQFLLIPRKPCTEDP